MSGRLRTARSLLGLGLALGWLAAAPPRSAAAAEWLLPLDGAAVTRPFDPPGTPYGRGHRGVDLGGTPGMVVRAAGAGTVGYAGMLAGRGVVTVLHAGGLRTTYEPVEIGVRAGQPVAAGDPLGALAAGHAGCPVAACLHWGLLRGEVYLDPMLLLSRGPVRLLPPARGSPDVPGSRSGSTPAAEAAPHAAVSPGWGPPFGLAGAALGLAAGALLLVRRPP